MIPSSSRLTLGGSATMLEIKDLAVSYGRIQAVRRVSLTVPDGSIVALLGANGAGKTTILRAVSGLLPIDSGSVSLDGNRVNGLAPERIVAAGISHVPEGRELFAGMTVEENLELGGFLAPNAGVIRAGMERVFAHFPCLAERRHQIAGTLSGGEQQMVAIGRALIARPRVMLLDEPSIGLAPLIVDQIFRIIRDINREGVTILLVEQNAVDALSLAQSAHVLEHGLVAMSGRSEDLKKDSRVVSSYLGVID